MQAVEQRAARMNAASPSVQCARRHGREDADGSGQKAETRDGTGYFNMGNDVKVNKALRSRSVPSQGLAKEPVTVKGSICCPPLHSHFAEMLKWTARFALVKI